MTVAGWVIIGLAATPAISVLTLVIANPDRDYD